MGEMIDITTEDTAAKADRLIYTAEVAKRYGIAPKTLLRMVRGGRIPQPLKSRFGKGECWRESVINKHLEELE